MSISWKFYRMICILQMTAAIFLFLVAVLNSVRYGGFMHFSRVLVYLLVVSLAIFAVTTLNNNYPETPITGSQKKTFNRLFLVNFIFIAFLFGFSLSEFRVTSRISNMLGTPIFQLPVGIWMMLVLETFVLVVQFVVLYGLYALRRQLDATFNAKQFEFEN